jgi:predicted transcriptional regulator of viral defense system
MTIKIKQITDSAGTDGLLFSSWMSKQGLDSKQQHSYMKSGWLEHVSRGVYKVAGSHPTLFAAVSCYNTQLDKQCVVGAQTALELHGFSHYVPMGKPLAFLFTDNSQKLPGWMLAYEWDRTIRYHTTSFLGKDMLGVETMTVEGRPLLVSSSERAMLEWLNLPIIANSLLDVYYVFEMMTTLRPALLQQLLERCGSAKVNRLFMYMAEKTGYQWLHWLQPDRINMGDGRKMISPTGRYISKYNMTIPKELADYE